MPHTRSTSKNHTPHAGKKRMKTASLSLDSDIIDLIYDDHKALKKLLKVMKSEEADDDEKQEAFESFAPLLIAHSRPEEQVLYAFMKEDEDLRTEGFEGEVEHGLADQLIEEAKRSDDHDLFLARIKVLAELVEHHLKEEENDLLPDFKRHSSKDERREMGHDFLDAKAEYENFHSVGAPSEKHMKIPTH